MSASNVLVIVIFCVFFIHVTQTTFTRTSDLKKSILDQILPKNANEVLIGPGNGTNGPTEVVVFMHILGIDKLNDEKMELTVRIYLRQLWKDDKLKYDSKGQFKHIVINDIDLIWTPDTFFSNEKKGQAYDITHPNVFLKIYPDGTVLCSRKLSITVGCPMNLKKFPFDLQACKLRLESYGSTTDDVIFLWRDYVPVTVSRSLHVPLFNLEKFLTFSEVHLVNTGKIKTQLISVRSCPIITIHGRILRGSAFPYLIFSFIIGQYSGLTLSFLFSRTFGYYLYNTFLPCAMLVILSWIPFWLNKKQLTSRLLLSVAPLLVGTIIIYDQHKSQAKVSYSTCLDCFTGTCLTFIFVSVIETVIIHVLAERKLNNENKDCTLNGNAHREENKIFSAAKAWIGKLPCKIEYIDIGARFLIPIIFGIFCIIYFTSINNNQSDADFTPVHGNQTKVTYMN